MATRVVKRSRRSTPTASWLCRDRPDRRQHDRAESLSNRGHVDVTLQCIGVTRKFLPDSVLSVDLECHGRVERGVIAHRRSIAGNVTVVPIAGRRVLAGGTDPHTEAVVRTILRLRGRERRSLEYQIDRSRRKHTPRIHRSCPSGQVPGIRGKPTRGEFDRGVVCQLTVCPDHHWALQQWVLAVRIPLRQSRKPTDI